MVTQTSSRDACRHWRCAHGVMIPKLLSIITADDANTTSSKQKTRDSHYLAATNAACVVCSSWAGTCVHAARPCTGSRRRAARGWMGGGQIQPCFTSR
jgi:hypothetical protein